MRSESPELPKKGKPLDYLPGVHERPEKGGKAKNKPSISAEAMRPKRGKKVSSEGALRASAAGEIGPDEEMELKDEDLVEVTDEAVLPVEDEDIVEDETVHMLTEADRKPADKPLFERIQPFVPSAEMKESAAIQHRMESAKKAKAEKKLAAEANDPMARLEKTTRKEQSESASQEGTSLELQVREAWQKFDAAKAAFEKIGDEYAERYLSAQERVNDPRKNYDETTKEFLIHAILSKDGLQSKHEAAVYAYWESESAYSERYAAWEAELAAKQEKLEGYKKAFEELVGEKQEESWFANGEQDEIANVRQQIAGNELEAPVGTPRDLAMLGFDQVFIDTYQETQARFDKLDEKKRNAGFFKKLFGGAKLERELEAARSDLASMQEDVTARRLQRERKLEEASMTPAQLEARRKSDEVKMHGIISRGH